MNGSNRGLSRISLIHNDLGLHARSAAIIAKIAREAKSSVWIIKGNKKADASSIIDVLMLGCPKGTRITLNIEDPSDLHILKEIAAQFEAGFGE